MQTKDTTTTPSSKEDNDDTDNYRIADVTVNNNDLRYSAELKRRIQEQKAFDKFTAGSGCCIICFNSNPFVLQEHHVAGRKHSDFTLTVCANHHAELSRTQNSWPKQWLQESLPEDKRVALMLRGMSDILRLASNEVLGQSEREADDIQSRGYQR